MKRSDIYFISITALEVFLFINLLPRILSQFPYSQLNILTFINAVANITLLITFFYIFTLLYKSFLKDEDLMNKNLNKIPKFFLLQLVLFLIKIASENFYFSLRSF
jgi:uncharacterized membrane protein YesL